MPKRVRELDLYQIKLKEERNEFDLFKRDEKIRSNDKMLQEASPSGNRTPVSRVTGGDTHHYTNEDEPCKGAFRFIHVETEPSGLRLGSARRRAGPGGRLRWRAQTPAGIYADSEPPEREKRAIGKNARLPASGGPWVKRMVCMCEASGPIPRIATSLVQLFFFFESPSFKVY